MSSELRQARRAEVDRDGRLVTATLTAELRRLLHGLAAQGDDPAHLWQLVEGKVAASRELLRLVTHTRICRRAERAATWSDSRPLPDELACYRHRGNYRGVFLSMAALGVILAPSHPTFGTARPDPATIARDLHVRGELWTFELAGGVHVFTTPGSHSDEVLAQHRPPTRTHAPVVALELGGDDGSV